MKKKKTLLGLIAAIAIIVIGICVWYFQVKKPHDLAETKFNAAVKEVEVKNTELTSAMNDAQKILDKKEAVYDNTTKEAFITALSDAKAAQRKIPDLPKKTADINAETKKLSEPLDYSSVINDISEKQTAYQNSVLQMKQITNPNEDFVIQRLKGIPNISGYQAVTEDHDPNGNLNKQGGYTSTVYFSTPLIDQSSVYGNDIVDKGTECGGAIEVYASEEDAEKRDSYLASFDGAGMLNSGSHKVLGTIVIRTSTKLTATQQNEFTNNITNKLLELQ
ncbi:EbhA [Dorea longicatena]|uniref:EbhA n=1 Tax=Dorea longicatena TaxID=88431 RepID=UPI001FF5DE05|nr:EbhA [Dorea longicatena]UOX54619.1 EbhA [Dorea longicatena]